MGSDNALSTLLATFVHQLEKLSAQRLSFPLAYQQALGMSRILTSLSPADWVNVSAVDLETCVKYLWTLGAQASSLECSVLYEKALALLAAYPSMLEYPSLCDLKADLYVALGRLRLQLSGQTPLISAAPLSLDNPFTTADYQLVLSSLTDYLNALALAKTPQKRETIFQALYQLNIDFTQRLLKPRVLELYHRFDKALQQARARDRDWGETLEQTLAQIKKWQHQHYFEAASALGQLLFERWPRIGILARVEQTLHAFIELNQGYLEAQKPVVQCQFINRYREIFTERQQQWQAQFPSSAEKVDVFQTQVHTDLQTFYRQLINDGELLLGQAPGRMCWLSLGSLARGDVTPRSDLECAILVEQKTPALLSYLQDALWLMEFNLLSLGETINNPEGLHFDAPPRVIELASLTTHLIETPVGLARYQTHGDTDTLAYSLLRPGFLAGDAELLKDYYRALPLPSSTRLHALLQAHTSDLAYELPSPFTSNELKRLWLQPIVLLIQDMALYYRLAMSITHPFSILNVLHQFPTDPNNNALPPIQLVNHFVQSALRSLRRLYQARIQAQRLLDSTPFTAEELRFIRYHLIEPLRSWGEWLIEQRPLPRIFHPGRFPAPDGQRWNVAWQADDWAQTLKAMLVPQAPSSALLSIKVQYSKGEGYLAAELMTALEAKQIFNAKGELQPQAVNLSRGRHIVAALTAQVQGRPISIHIKFFPEMPGLEAAAGELARLCCGHGISYSTLMRWQIGSHLYPVLVSKTVEGPSLHDVMYTPTLTPLLQQLQSARLSDRLLVNLLLNFEDDKPDNEIVSPEIESDEVQALSLVCIDPDRCFYPSTLQTEIGYMPLVKSVLYCLEGMNAPVDETSRLQWLALTPHLLLKRWLLRLTEIDEAYRQLFTLPEQGQFLQEQTRLGQQFARLWQRQVADINQSFIPIRLPENLLTQLYYKLTTLQAFILKHPKASFATLLKHIEPRLGHYYAKLLMHPTPVERFEAGPGTFYRPGAQAKHLTQASLHQTWASLRGKPLTLALLQQQRGYFVNEALDELRIATLREQTLSALQTKLYRTEEVALIEFQMLAHDGLREQVIRSLDWSVLLLPNGMPHILYQEKLLKRMKGTSFRKLNLRDCRALTLPLLKELIQYSPTLRSLDLTGCVQLVLKLSVLQELIQLASELQKLLITCPENPAERTMLSQFYGDWAKALAARQHAHAALRAYTFALDIYYPTMQRPFDAAFFGARSYIHRQLGQHEHALKDLRKALQAPSPQVYSELLGRKALSPALITVLDKIRIHRASALNLSKLSLRPDENLLLLHFLSAIELNLEILDLSNNALDDAAIGILVQTLKNFPRLYHLNLAHNRINEVGVRCLEQAARAPHAALEILDLSANPLSLAPLKDLNPLFGRHQVNHFFQSLQNEYRVEEQWREYGLHDEGAIAPLKDLNRLLGRRQVNRFFQSLQSDYDAEEIKWIDYEIHDEDAMALASFLKTNATVKKIDLSYNHLTDKGAQAFIEALNFNSTVEVLNLQGNTVSEMLYKTLSDLLTLHQVRNVLKQWHQADCTESKLDWGDKGIGDEEVMQLATLLKTNRTLKEIYLNGNQITDKGAQALLEALEINRSVEKIELRNNSISAALIKKLKRLIGPREVASLLKRWQQAGCTETNLYWWDKGIGDEEVMQLAALLKTNTTLKEIYLSDNQITDKGVHALLAALEINRSVEKIEVRNNSISAILIKELDKLIGPREVASLLKRWHQAGCTETNLYWWDKGIGDEEVMQLAALLKTNRTLKEIYLNGNQITDKGGHALLEALEINRSVEKIELRDNSISAALIKKLGRLIRLQEVASLLEHWQQAGCSETQLDWGDKGIGDEEVIKLAALLKTNTTLITIHLEDNLATDKGAQILLEALRINTTVEEIGLAGNPIEASLIKEIKWLVNRHGVRNAFTHWQQGGCIETYLNWADKGINDEEASQLAAVLKTNVTFKGINLSHNQITDFGAEILMDALRFNTYVQLHIKHNLMSKKWTKNLELSPRWRTFIKNASTGYLFTELLLDDAHIGDEETIEIAAYLNTPSPLTVINLKHNHITDKGALTLLNTLQKQALDIKIDLAGNSISEPLSQLILQYHVKIQLNQWEQQGIQAEWIHWCKKGVRDEEVLRLAELLKVDTSIARIDLQNNDITDNGASALLAALAKNTTLEKIDVSQNPITDKLIFQLNHVLNRRQIALVLLEWEQAGCRETHLKWGNKGIMDEEVVRLSAILSSNTTLITLDLEHNYITDRGAQALVELLHLNQQLVRVTLEGNPIRSTSLGKKIAELTRRHWVQYELAMLKQTKMALLNWSFQRLTDEDIKELVAYLLTDNQLTELDLSHNTLTDKGASLLIEALHWNMNITELKLEGNPISSVALTTVAHVLAEHRIEENIQQLKRGLFEGTTLDWSQQFINDKHLWKLLDALNASTSLTQLDLRHNQISNDGARALLGCMQAYPMLACIQLEGNPMDIYYQVFLSTKPIVFEANIFNSSYFEGEKWNWSYQALTQRILYVLLDHFEQNVQMPELIDLSYNQLTDADLSLLEQLFQRLPPEIKIDLTGNRFSSIAFNALIEQRKQRWLDSELKRLAEADEIIEKVDWSYRYLTDNDLIALMQALMHNNLASIALKMKNSRHYLLMLLMQNNLALTEINLSHNQLTKNSTGYLFAIQRKMLLFNIQLDHNLIDPDEIKIFLEEQLAQSIASLLRDFSSSFTLFLPLKVLDTFTPFFNKAAGPKSWGAILNYIQQTPSLRWIDCSQRSLTPMALKQLATCIKENTTLLGLNLAQTKLSDAHLPALFTLLTTCQGLLWLDLSHNYLTPSCFEALQAALIHHPSLLEVNLEGNAMKVDLLSKFDMQAVQRPTTLHLTEINALLEQKMLSENELRAWVEEGRLPLTLDIISNLPPARAETTFLTQLYQDYVSALEINTASLAKMALPIARHYQDGLKLWKKHLAQGGIWGLFDMMRHEAPEQIERYSKHTGVLNKNLVQNFGFKPAEIKLGRAELIECSNALVPCLQAILNLAHQFTITPVHIKQVVHLLEEAAQRLSCLYFKLKKEVEAVNSERDEYLVQAVHEQNIEKIAYWLDRGANPYGLGLDGYAAIEIARFYPNSFIKWGLEKKADEFKSQRYEMESQAWARVSLLLMLGAVCASPIPGAEDALVSALMKVVERVLSDAYPDKAPPSVLPWQAVLMNVSITPSEAYRFPVRFFSTQGQNFWQKVQLQRIKLNQQSGSSYQEEREKIIALSTSPL